MRWVNNNLDNLGKANRLYDLINFTKKIADRENLSLIYDERASIIRKVHKVPTAIFGGTLCKYRGK